METVGILEETRLNILLEDAGFNDNGLVYRQLYVGMTVVCCIGNCLLYWELFVVLGIVCCIGCCVK